MDSAHFSHINGRFTQSAPRTVDAGAYPAGMQDDQQKKFALLGESSSTKGIFPKTSREKGEADGLQKQRKRLEGVFSFSTLLHPRLRKKVLLYLLLIGILLLSFMFIFFLSEKKNFYAISSSIASESLKSAQEFPKEELVELSLNTTIPLSEEKLHSSSASFLSRLPSEISAFAPAPSRGPEKRFTSVLSIANRDDMKDYVEQVIRVARSIHRGGVNRHPNMYEFLVCATIQKKEATELEETIHQVWREEEQKITQLCPRCFSDVEKRMKTTFSMSRRAARAANVEQESSFSADEGRVETVQEEDNSNSFTQVRVRVHSTGSLHRSSGRKHESSSFLLLRCIAAVKSEFFIIESPKWRYLADKELSSSSQTIEPSLSFPTHLKPSKHFSDAVLYTQRVFNIALQTLSSNRVMDEPLVVDAENPEESKVADVFKLKHYVYASTFQPTASIPAVLPSLMVVPGYDEMENKTYLDHVLQSFLAALEEQRSDGVRSWTAASPISFSPSSSSEKDENLTKNFLSSKPHHDEENKEESHNRSTKTMAHGNAAGVSENYISIFWKLLPSDFYGVNRLYHCRMAPFYNMRREAIPFFSHYSTVNRSAADNGPKEDLSVVGTSASESNSRRKIDRKGNSTNKKELDNPYEETKTTTEEKSFSVVHSPTSASTTSPSRAFEKTATVCELLTSSSSGMHQFFIAGPVFLFFQEFCHEWRKLVSPYRDDVLEETQDFSTRYEDRDISSSLCAYVWLRTLKEQEQKYLIRKKKRQSLDTENSTSPPPPHNKMTPPVFSQKIGEGVANASVKLTKSSPLDQFSEAVVDPEVFLSRSPFVHALKETTRWDRKRKGFEESLPYLLDLVLNISLKEVYWNTSHQVQLQYKWKDPNQDVICLPSDKVLWDTTPSMYRTNWFMRSILFSCLQRGELCIGKDNEKVENTMWRMRSFVSLSGKWAKGQWQVCFTGGGTHFFDSTA